MARQLVRSGSPYEEIVGFSRAVRLGNHVAVAGTGPIGENGVSVAPGDAGAQARRCYQIIQAALEEVGARLEHVVRTRTFLTNIDDWQAVAQVRGEYFRAIKPVETIVQVTRFVDPEWLVELEVDAIIDD